MNKELVGACVVSYTEILISSGLIPLSISVQPKIISSIQSLL